MRPQETFLKAIRYYDRYVHKGRCKAFLYRIAANTCVDMYRKKDGVSLEDIPEELPIEESGFDRIHADVDFRQRIRALPPEQQEVLQLRFCQELTLRQIARVTETPLRTVQSRLRIALKRLKNQLEKEGYHKNRDVKTQLRQYYQQADMTAPEVLVLDEPTSGLDPGERVRFRNLLSEFAHDRIVLISTHIVSDVEYISTRNAVMKGGELLACGTTEELVKLVEGKVWTARISAESLGKYEQCLSIVNLRNEENGAVSIRYLAEAPAVSGSVAAAPRLEDMYLWMFPQEASERR